MEPGRATCRRKMEGGEEGSSLFVFSAGSEGSAEEVEDSTVAQGPNVTTCIPLTHPRSENGRRARP